MVKVGRGQVSKKAIALALGISQPAVSRHVRHGMPTDDIDRAVGWYRANVDARQRDGQAGELVPSRERALRERLLQAQVARAEAEAAQLAGTLATTASIVAAARRAAYAIVAGLEQLPDRVSVEFGQDDAQRQRARRALQRECDNLRRMVATELRGESPA